MDNQAHIRIYSDIEENFSIDAALKQLELKNINIEVKYPRTFEINADEIIIIHVASIESKYLGRLLNLKNNVQNKIIFVLSTEDTLLVSSIAKLGFNDIFVFPYEMYKFIAYLHEIVSNSSYKTKISSFFPENLDFDVLLGGIKEVNKMTSVIKRTEEASSLNIMILGETGTGKGLLARAIHNNSKNFHKPFVDIVCTAIPESLMESELFGHEPGAFTSAKNRKYGLFELADNGTLFLDEIGDLSLNLQSKILRSIEKKVIRRLGGIDDIPINARIISATNRNLPELVEEKLFRRDLYHRLNVIAITLPPLKERRDEILKITEFFISKYSIQFQKKIKFLEKKAKEFILNYEWPGNLRELRNSIERAVILSENGKIELKHFSALLQKKLEKVSMGEFQPLLPQIIRMDLNFENINLKELNQTYAREVLKKLNGNKSQVARVLNISRPKLDTLLK
jgi:two-component system, NtrC family, response regulator AtoC